MEVWRSGSLKHRLKLSEQQRGSAATFSSILLLPEVQQMQFALFLFLYWYVFLNCDHMRLFYWFSISFFFACVCDRGRSCGVLAQTREKCIFGQWRTPNHSIVWLCRTAPGVTAWLKSKIRLLHRKELSHPDTRPPSEIKSHHLSLFPSSRCGLDAWGAPQPKGRFTFWTQTHAKYWKSFMATMTRWRHSALLRIGTSSVERVNMMERSLSGRWNRGFLLTRS